MGDQFPSLSKSKQRMIDEMDRVLSVEIPTLMRKLPGIEEMKSHAAVVDAGASSPNPFAGNVSAKASDAWIISMPQKASYDNVFDTLQLSGNKATGGVCKDVMLRSGLAQQLLSKIWTMSDIDGDGCLDRDEFALAMFLIEEGQRTGAVPDTLPVSYVPPSKRG